MSSNLSKNTGNQTQARAGAAVSRKLRAMGWNISPAGRKYRYDGIYVSAGASLVTVLIDLGIAAKNQRVCQTLAEELAGQGWATGMSTTYPTEATGAAFIHFEYTKA